MIDFQLMYKRNRLPINFCKNILEKCLSEIGMRLK